MNAKIKYPIGIQTFEKIRTEGFLYVDKTDLIYNLVHDNQYVFLSRPRRFGKSLLVSTLEEYFRGNKELFKGLAIEKLETEWTVHPVIRFDLSGENYDSPNRLVHLIKSRLNDYETDCGTIPDPDDSIGLRLNKLISEMHKVYGKQVVILVDEYDKPLLDSIHDDDLQESVRRELEGFYSNLKKCDKYIKFALLTGVGKFGHVSIFSGLNNLIDISLVADYNALCGISETEFHDNFGPSVRNFAAANEMTEDKVWEKFKKQYDGYHFSKKSEGIYNPFSVLKAFHLNEFGAYWFASGTPRFLVQLVKRNRYALTDLQGALLTADDLSDMTDPVNDCHALFFQAGYLTIKGYEKETNRYLLDFPNEEVRSGFWNSLYKQYVLAGIPSRTFDIFSFVDDVRQGRVEEFMTRLKALVASVLPGVERHKEIHFQNVMQIIFKMLGLTVQTEVVTAMGRCDMTVKTRDYVYIMEFKIDSTAQAAIDQIEDKGYAHPYAADDRLVYLIGANFSTKTNELDDYLIVRYEGRARRDEGRAD